MTFENVATFELAAAELAGVGGGNAALVALVAHQGGLVQVGAPAPRARVLVGHGVAGGVVVPVLAVLHELHGAGEGGEGVVQQGEHGAQPALACTTQG